LLELDSSISELQMELKSLIHTRSELQWSMEHSTEILNPVRRLPEDMLHEIFTYCLSNLTPSRTSFHCANSPPWILGMVYRMWGQTMLLFPQLW
ncbi:uncharacterized protein BT62DRAFT_856377, partial [Guyanagaster necrorhizus]